MRIVWTVLIIVVIASVACWVRGEADFHIVSALPLLGGRPTWCL